MPKPAAPRCALGGRPRLAGEAHRPSRAACAAFGTSLGKMKPGHASLHPVFSSHVSGACAGFGSGCGGNGLTNPSNQRADERGSSSPAVVYHVQMVGLHGEVHDPEPLATRLPDRLHDEMVEALLSQARQARRAPQCDMHGPPPAMDRPHLVPHVGPLPLLAPRALPTPTVSRRHIERQLRAIPRPLPWPPVHSPSLGM